MEAGLEAPLNIYMYMYHGRIIEQGASDNSAGPGAAHEGFGCAATAPPEFELHGETSAKVGNCEDSAPASSAFRSSRDSPECDVKRAGRAACSVLGPSR